MKIKRSSIINEYSEICVYCLDSAGNKTSCCGENHFAPGITVEESFRGIKYEQVYLLDEVEVIEDSELASDLLP